MMVVHDGKLLIDDGRLCGKMVVNNCYGTWLIDDSYWPMVVDDD